MTREVRLDSTRLEQEVTNMWGVGLGQRRHADREQGRGEEQNSLLTDRRQEKSCACGDQARRTLRSFYHNNRH